MQSLGTHGGRLQKLRELIKKLMALTLTLALFAPAHASAAVDPHAKYHGVLPDAFYDGLATCETGHNVNHSTRTYTGMFGVNRQSWRTWSDYPSAKGRSPIEQVRVVDALAFKSHINPDGRKIWRVGPWGFGCVRREKSLQAFICKSRNSLVARWKRNC